jgi:cytochrome b561
MRLFSTRFRYGAVAQAFHWLTAILAVTAYFMGPGGSEQRVYSSALDFTRQTHETVSVTVATFPRYPRPAYGLFDTRAGDTPQSATA